MHGRHSSPPCVFAFSLLGYSCRPCNEDGDTMGHLLIRCRYTESLFAFLSFWGMALLAEGKRFNAAWVFMAAALTRSNGILCCGFFLHDFMGKCLKDRKWVRRILAWLLTVYIFIRIGGSFGDLFV